jgi:hypothetical protein
MTWSDNVIEGPRRYIVRFELKCGENTCASEPGMFCQFLGAIHFGTKPVCLLFPSDDNSYTALHEQDGWVQRCTTCKEHTK